MASKRTEFTKTNKRKLAERVAWRCSYPGCETVTIGPGTESSNQVIKLGDAAHIHAAASGGPRFDPSMTITERRSIDNGVWMCQRHARLIDADYTNYSADTLRQWKKQKENQSYQALQLPERGIRAVVAGKGLHGGLRRG